MSTEPAPAGYKTSEDEKILHKLGYAQELFRGMGGFQNFAISFTIISILAGCLTSYWIVFERGGPMWVDLELADHRSVLDDHRAVRRGDRVRLSDGRRSLLLGIEARRSRLGLGDRLVQPDRPDRGHCGDRLRPGDVRRGAVHLLVRLRAAHERLGLLVQRVGLHPLRRLPAGGGADQRVRHPRHVDDQHRFGVLAHDRRRLHRGRADLRPRQPPVAQLRLHRAREQHGLRRRIDVVRQRRVLARAGARTADGAVHDHGLRRVGPHGGGDAPGVAHGGRRHVHVGRRLGVLRLDPAARRDVRGAEHGLRHRPDQRRRCGRATDVGGVDGRDVGRDACSSSASSRSSSA